MSTVKMEAETEQFEVQESDESQASELQTSELQTGEHESADPLSDENQTTNDLPDVPDNLTGLVDPNKPRLEDDVVLEADLAIARNLRRLEIHRYQIAAALSNISEEEIGQLHEHEDEIELSKSDEKYAEHINQINTNAQTKRQERLNPDQMLDQRLERILTTLRLGLQKVTTKVDLKSWEFMRHNLYLSWHQHRYDREIEQRLFSPLAKFRNMSRSQTLREREEQAPCAPVRLVDWSLDCIAAYQQGGSFRHFLFIDPEAGHGRTLLMASHRDFRAIYGIETRGNFAEDATMNIAQYPRTYMTQRQVELVTRDFRLMEWPALPMVVQIFNPESSNWLHQLMEHLSQSFEQAPRQIYLIIIGNKHKEVTANFPAFQQFTPPSSNLELLSLMSPYEIDFYSSVVS